MGLGSIRIPYENASNFGAKGPNGPEWARMGHRNLPEWAHMMIQNAVQKLGSVAPNVPLFNKISTHLLRNKFWSELLLLEW